MVWIVSIFSLSPNWSTHHIRVCFQNTAQTWCLLAGCKYSMSPYWLQELLVDFFPSLKPFRASLIAQLIKNPLLGQEDHLEKGQATHSSILGLPLRLSWLRICLQCGRPGLDPWVGKIPWRRERVPTPVFWPGEFHGRYSLWGCKEVDITERLSLSSFLWFSCFSGCPHPGATV